MYRETSSDSERDTGEIDDDRDKDWAVVKGMAGGGNAATSPATSTASHEAEAAQEMFMALFGPSDSPKKPNKPSIDAAPPRSTTKGASKRRKISVSADVNEVPRYSYNR